MVSYFLAYYFGSNARSVTEELLVDFREMLGEHSGENIAEAVWETLVTYGIEGRVVIVLLTVTDVLI